MSLNILLTLLNEKLQDLLHAEAEVTESKAETLLTYANPYGGKPLQVLYRPGEDFKVTLNKTPRYYQQDSTKRLLADVANYAEGKTVSLDCTDHNGATCWQAAARSTRISGTPKRISGTGRSGTGWKKSDPVCPALC